MSVRDVVRGVEDRRRILPVIRRPLTSSTIVAFLVLIVFWAVTDILIPGFATLNHTQYVLQTGAFLGIVAAGQTLVVMMGGIDLSVSGVLALGGVVCAQLISANDVNPAVAIIVALAICTAIGLVNGFGILHLGLPPLVMTLAVLTIIQGGLLLYTAGSPRSATVPFLNTVADGNSLGIPNAFWVWVAILVFGVWLLSYSRYGRYAYAIGVNIRAARLSGVPLRGTTYLMYAVCGLLAGVAGILLFGYTNNSYLTMGDPYLLGSIAAVVLGGTSILGGKGHFLGTVAGALLLTVLGSVLPVWNIPQAGRDVIEGVLIILLLLAYARERAD
jgi:ribose transport system permease protein